MKMFFHPIPYQVTIQMIDKINRNHPPFLFIFKHLGILLAYVFLITISRNFM